MTQLTKQKLNFIGLHSYPMQEPLVWVGDPKHLDAQGNVAAAGGWPVKKQINLLTQNVLEDTDGVGAPHQEGSYATFSLY